MEAVLWQVLAGTRGGPNRARILKALEERPRNANQLAADFDLAYKTVRYHLDVLEENNIVRSNDEDYGSVYLLTDQTRDHRDVIEDILDQVGVEKNA
jgi:DNA-binding transcriptional ArsR family regulator